MTNQFGPEELRALVLSSNREKPLFLARLSPLPENPFSPAASSSAEKVWVACKVTEERYPLALNHDISLAPMLDGFGLQHFYQRDFANLVQSRQVIVLDQNIAWKKQIPGLPVTTLASRITKIQDAIGKEIKRWLALPCLTR